MTDGMFVSGFQPATEVIEPEALFGQNEHGSLLESLIAQVRLGTNCQLIGERRAGKSSVLRCAAKLIENGFRRLLPVYVNARQFHEVKGYADAYRLLIAHIHIAWMARVGSLEISVAGTVLAAEGTLPEHLDTLRGIGSSRVEAGLEHYLSVCQRERVGVLLLLDEYEHFMRHTLEGEKGAFSHLRKVSSEGSAVGGPKPLTYVIAGVHSWEMLCDTIGSPEFNNIGSVHYVEPIGLDAFGRMWSDALERSSEDVRGKVQNSGLDVQDVYVAAGGWPFFGKVIGQHLAAGAVSVDEFYAALLQHFRVIWTRLNDEERTGIAAAVDGVNGLSGGVISDLVRRGLLQSERGGSITTRGLLWTRFCRDAIPKGSPTRGPSAERTACGENEELHLLVDEIAGDVADINENAQLSTGEEVFVCTNHDVQIYGDLRRRATNRDQFTHFALSVYNLLYERTAAIKLSKTQEPRTKTLQRLPEGFRRERAIIRAVAALRHHFGKGHLTALDSFDAQKGGMPLAEVLGTYIGKNAMPTDGEYEKLQAAVLRDVGTYLRDLKSHLSGVQTPLDSSGPSSSD